MNQLLKFICMAASNLHGQTMAMQGNNNHLQVRSYIPHFCLLAASNSSRGGQGSKRQMDGSSYSSERQTRPKGMCCLMDDIVGKIQAKQLPSSKQSDKELAFRTKSILLVKHHSTHLKQGCSFHRPRYKTSPLELTSVGR